jgi:hypothetical protein
MPGRSLRSLCVGGRGPSAVEVTAPPPTVHLGPELAFQLHQAPDPGAVGAEVGLDLSGQLADGSGPGRAKSPPNQAIEHEFESGSGTAA